MKEVPKWRPVYNISIIFSNQVWQLVEGLGDGGLFAWNYTSRQLNGFDWLRDRHDAGLGPYHIYYDLYHTYI